MLSQRLNNKFSHIVESYENYNKAIEQFNKDSFELAINYFNKVVSDSLLKHATNNIELCSLFVNKNLIFEEKQAYFIDKRDNHKYKISKFGEDVWMTENLAFKTDSIHYKIIDENTSNNYGCIYNYRPLK